MKKTLVSILIGLFMAGLSGQAWAGSVVAADLDCTNLAGCVQTNEISAGAVTESKVATGAITNGKIADAAVTSSKIATGAVTTTNIATGAVTTATIANGAVTDTQISGTISGSKLGSHTHNGSDIADGTIGTSKISDGSVTTNKVVDGAVTNGKLADWSITGSKVVDYSITDIKISSNAITTTKIEDSAVTSAKVADGAITDAKISGIIGSDKLGTYSRVFVVHKGAANNYTTFTSLRSAIDYIFSQGIQAQPERNAILVMPGRYEEDLSVLNCAGCGGAGPSFNVDIIGASRTGSVIALVNNPIGDSPQAYVRIRPGMYLKNLTVEGVFDIAHSQNAGVIDCNISSQWHLFWGGWQTIKNFTIDNVYIETPVDYLAIALSGTDENDTLKFNNIHIKNGKILLMYPISTKAFKFSNITFTGTGGSTDAFEIWYANANVSSATINFDNIAIDGNYAYAFNIGDSNGAKINTTNSKLIVSQGLLTTNSSGNNEVVINNSVVSIASSPGSRVKIGNSQIGSIQLSNGSVKVVNSHDENFDPYNNGLY